MGRGISAWLPVGLYAATIVFLSSLSGSELAGQVSDYDKLIHGVEYAVLSALLARALMIGPPKLAPWVAAAAAMLLATGFGVTDEWHQSFVPGRSSSAADVAADAVGALLGAGAAALLYLRLAPRRGDRIEGERHGHH